MARLPDGRRTASEVASPEGIGESPPVALDILDAMYLENGILPVVKIAERARRVEDLAPPPW